ncbi:hypothetical protein QTP86_011421 [Hemibagrus guttatus]|nr:hypothetical protein QTP86_011421 [Hemibagrus guttatus]
MERLSLSAGLGTPRGPSERAGGSVWGEGDTCNNLKTIWQKDLGINIHDNDCLDILANVAARMILRHWKCPKTPDLKHWFDGMIEFASYDYTLGRLQSEGEMKKNMGPFLAAYKNGLCGSRLGSC